MAVKSAQWRSDRNCQDVLAEVKSRITREKSRSVYQRFGRVQSAIVAG